MINEQKYILYIGGFELPDKNAAAQRVIANAKILTELDYKVILIGTDKTIDNSTPFLETKMEYEGFIYYSVNYPKTIFEWISHLTTIKSIHQFDDQSISHIIAYNYPGLSLVRLQKYCKKKNILLLADCTEWYEAKGNFVFSLIKGLDVYIRMKIVQPKLDGLIVISDYLYDYYKTKVKNIVNIPPLVDVSMEKWKGLDHRIDKNLVNLVYAGSPGGQKDRLDKVVSALEKLREQGTVNFFFNIIGLTLEDYTKIYGTGSLPHSFEAFIGFKGKLPHLIVLKEVAKSSYQIFLRDNNLTNTAGFPTKFVEAISAGTPVLANSSSNISEYLIAGKTGFLLNSNSEVNLVRDLDVAINKGEDVISGMKSYCAESAMFDYRRYLETFRLFFDRLNSKNNR